MGVGYDRILESYEDSILEFQKEKNVWGLSQLAFDLLREVRKLKREIRDEKKLTTAYPPLPSRRKR